MSLNLLRVAYERVSSLATNLDDENRLAEYYRVAGLIKYLERRLVRKTS